MKRFVTLVLLLALSLPAVAAPKTWWHMDPAQKKRYTEATDRVMKGETVWVVTGDGPAPEGAVRIPGGVPGLDDDSVYRLYKAGDKYEAQKEVPVAPPVLPPVSFLPQPCPGGT